MLKEIQKSLNSSIIIAVLCLALGIAFIVIPEKSINLLSNVLGIILIIYGVFDIINSFRTTYILSSSFVSLFKSSNKFAASIARILFKIMVCIQ